MRNRFHKEGYNSIEGEKIQGVFKNKKNGFFLAFRPQK
jgi:hypothetical protein